MTTRPWQSYASRSGAGLPSSRSGVCRYQESATPRACGALGPGMLDFLFFKSNPYDAILPLSNRHRSRLVGTAQSAPIGRPGKSSSSGRTWKQPPCFDCLGAARPEKVDIRDAHPRSRQGSNGHLSRPRRLHYFGCDTIRRYGLGAFQPPGNFCFASASDTAGTMMTSSPCFQFTGVATLCLAVN